jgi:hypothetical protein
MHTTLVQTDCTLRPEKLDGVLQELRGFFRESPA